ncbi:S-layer homology domain-containing protein, partial [Paenibacillus agaridevorans]|uniref:S-layer homology domain-containing protein n=1 Tax=Paenibacillus agaridevorans TaxID=171404 RepID=UPI001C626AC0
KLVLDDNNRPLVAYRYKTAANPDIFEVKLARFDEEEWVKETVYASEDTKAAIDITSHGTEIRVYYATAAGADRARVSILADGEWHHDVLAPGIPIERLSVESSSLGSDILYLVDITNKRLYYGRKDAAIVAPELPPVWNDGVLSATNVGTSAVTLTWSGISGDEDVSGYKLYNGSNEIIELGGDVTSYRVTGLTADTAYTFKVEAGTNKNVWSTNGPSVNVRTAADICYSCTPVDPVTPPAQEPEPEVEEPAEQIVPVEAQRAKALAQQGSAYPGRLSRGGSMVEVARDPAATGTLLPEPLTLTLSYEPAENNIALLGVYYLNETSGRWEYVGAITESDSHQFQVAVHHAGVYSVMAYDHTFEDVPEEHWAHQALKEMTAKHIVNGVSDRLFKPTGMTTRAEFATLLVRALGLQSAGAHSFADVPSDAWYAASVGAAYEANLIKGVSANEFGPDKMISREEMAVMLVRAYAFVSGKQPVPKQGAAPLNDSNRISSWAESEVAAAIALGLMQGKGQGHFDPKTPTQRAESIQAVWNLLQLMK